MRIDPLNPKDRALLEKTESGKKALRDYYKDKKINPELSNHNTNRKNNLIITEKTGLSKSNNKYGNHKTIDIETGNIVDSKWELEVLRRLRNLEDKKIISNLSTQFIYQIIVADTKIAKLKLDFVFNWENIEIYADAKSKFTSPPGFKLKKKLFEAITGKTIHLIIKGDNSIIDDIEKV